MDDLPEILEEKDADGRGARARRNISSAVLLNLVAAIASFIRVPLLLDDLGASRYGFWVAALAVIQTMSMADLGIQSALTQVIARFRGEGREGEVPALVATAFWTILGFCAALFVLIGVAIVFFWPVGDIANAMVDESAAKTVLLVGIGCSLLLQGPRVLYSARAGYERVSSLNLLETGVVIVQLLGLVAILSKWPHSLVAIVTWTMGTELLWISMMAVFVTMTDSDRFSVARSLVNRRALQALYPEAKSFLLLTVGGALKGRFDNIIIILVLVPSMVARYSPTLQVFLVALTLLALVATNLWPAYAHSVARGDWEWLNRVFRQTTLILMCAAAMGAVAASLFGRELVLGWVGTAGFAGTHVIWILAVWFVLQVWRQNVAQMVISEGRTDIVTRWTFIEGGLNVGLTFWLARTHGLAGAALASAISAIVAGVVPLSRSAVGLSGDRLSYPWVGISKLLAVSSLCLVAGVAVRLAFNLDEMSLMTALEACLFTIAAFAILAWSFVFDEGERNLLRTGLRSLISRDW
ncbi:MAG: hypothetical protein QOG04_2342 [Actinomycetota bacterium]|jgi:O-antigen/teichoic acid export membrane protein|nr:hypothetical protein [Actinomycetota bacterium]